MNRSIVLNNWHFLHIVVTKWDSSAKPARILHTGNRYSMVNCTFNAQARQAVSVLLCVGAWKWLPIGGIKIVNRLKSAGVFFLFAKDIYSRTSHAQLPRMVIKGWLGKPSLLERHVHVHVKVRLIRRHLSFNFSFCFIHYASFVFAKHILF